MPNADPADQRRLLEVAATDRAIAAAQHRRTTLPELGVIAESGQQLAQLRTARVNAETEVADLDAEGRKLDAEIDQVRARADRDAQRLASGAGPAKDLSSLQHEIDTLARRQADLEDQALDQMERRETADATLQRVRTEYDELAARVAQAESRRDDQFADIDDELNRLRGSRDEQSAGLPAELLALYERIHGTGKVGAAVLRGSQCEACRLTLDAAALAEIRAAAADAVVRCSECGAILIRS